MANGLYFYWIMIIDKFTYYHNHHKWDNWGNWLNPSPPEQNGKHFAYDILKCIVVNGKFCILINISMKFVHRGQTNIPALVEIMAWRRWWPVSMAHICGTRGKLVNPRNTLDRMYLAGILEVQYIQTRLHDDYNEMSVICKLTNTAIGP